VRSQALGTEANLLVRPLGIEGRLGALGPGGLFQSPLEVSDLALQRRADEKRLHGRLHEMAGERRESVETS